MRELYGMYGGALHRYLSGLCYGQPHLVEDLVQETLLRAWRNIETLNPDATTLLPWLFTVARRVAIDAARARRVRPVQTDDADVASLPLDVDPIDQVVIAQTIRQALPRISKDHREVVIDLYLRGRTIAETAARLGIPEGTVKSRAYHALRSLRAVIGPLHSE
jgi:RNA polymerase sigma-70 factor (ECF subfamily)